MLVKKYKKQTNTQKNQQKQKTKNTPPPKKKEKEKTVHYYNYIIRIACTRYHMHSGFPLEKKNPESVIIYNDLHSSIEKNYQISCT